MEAAETSWRSLGELFVERGLISEADLERTLAEQTATNRPLADILVREGLVSGHDITATLMDQMQRFGGAAGDPQRFGQSQATTPSTSRLNRKGSRSPSCYPSIRQTSTLSTSLPRPNMLRSLTWLPPGTP